MNVNRFPWLSLISMDSHRFDTFLGQGVSRPLASCGILWRPVAACAAGLDPPNIKTSDSGGLVPGCLDAGRIGMDWRRWRRGLEWEEGIGRNFHTLELQELGGFVFLNFLSTRLLLKQKLCPWKSADWRLMLRSLCHMYDHVCTCIHQLALYLRTGDTETHVRACKVTGNPSGFHKHQATKWLTYKRLFTQVR